MVDPPESTSTFSVESALDADIVLDEETAYDAETAYEDVIANDAVVARDEDSAQLAVPSNEPVTPLPLKYNPLEDINSEPVMTALPVNGNPGVAFIAYDAVVALDAVTAWDAVP